MQGFRGNLQDAGTPIIEAEMLTLGGINTITEVKEEDCNDNINIHTHSRPVSLQ
jgi:hypothetical protein